MRSSFFALGLSLFLFLAPRPAHAQTQVSRAEVEAILSGFEDVPTLAEIGALGPTAVPVLVAIHDDAQVIQPVRLRAVEAMGAFHTAEARTFLLRVMNDPHEGTIVVREAAEALAQSAGEGGVQPISRLLTSTDRTLREGAIVALGRIRAESARHQLELQLARETETDLRARITALLAR